ncbi:MAG: hypothetical protein CVT49_02240 [candidate division Zixibacteria bacterium HGW-Zixibacteria-1]|nr:MAG: hypothetical protein CVT49_02240 [candidate division Zixibacteria bacterium HGW-Zixibacteria-1]
MKYLPGLLFIFFSFIISVNAQIKDDSAQNRDNKPPCILIEFNSFDKFIKYYDSGNFDSIYAMVDFVTGFCNAAEPVYRMKILSDIVQNQFDENNYDSTLLDYLLYNSNKRYQFWPPVSSSLYFSEYTITQEDIDKYTRFDSLTHRIADSCVMNIDSTNIEYLICRLYTGDTAYFFDALRNRKYPESKITREYHTRAKNILTSPLGSLYGLAGVWQGVGNYDFFGTHPQVGIGMSVKKVRAFCDLAILFGFVNSKESYLVDFGGAVAGSNSFYDFYIGLEPGYGLVKKNRYQFDLLGGIGYETLQARKLSNKNSSTWLRAININGGIGLKYFYDPFETRYLSVQLRIIHTNFENGAGDALAGEAISLRFIWAFLGNQKRAEVERLHYF